MNYELTAEARKNILEIVDYIAEDNVVAALNVLDDLERTFPRLGETPGIGHYREDLLPNSYRFYLVHSYLIVYRWQQVPV